MDHEEAANYFSKEYEKARKKYKGIPKLGDLDKEWDILESVSRERHFPRNVITHTRWHMMRAINGWASYLHEFILPSQHSAVSMEEYNYFSDKEKEEIVHVINWIMYKNREANALQLDEDDKLSVAFISSAWKEWKTRKPVLRKILKKNADVWRQKIKT